MPRHHRIGVGLVAAGTLAATVMLVPVGSASAVSHWPGAPTGVHVAATGTTGFTVDLDRAANTTTYRLWTSRSKDDLWVASLGQARSGRRTVSFASPHLPISGLTYVAAPYYYRVATEKDGNRRYSPILAVSLRPAAPSAVTALSDGTGLRLTWNSVAATGFTVVQSTDAAMVAGRRVYSIREQANQFTPYGLTTGTTYYFQVRALNGPTASAYSAKVSAQPQGGRVNLRLMAYNLLVLSSDGTRGGAGAGEVIRPWNTERKAAAAALVARGNPDVIAVQEGSNYTGSTWHTPRQVDAFASALGSSYTVARTQGFPGDSDYRLTGVHIVYRNTTYENVGNGGHWDVGHGKWAAYQLLRHRSTGAELLAVSVHLTSLSGAGYDSYRRTETQDLVDTARSYAAAHGGVPIVYAGDFGSVRMSWHPYDAPGVVMRSTRAADAISVAQTVTNAAYSSVNQYRRTPIRGAGSVDRIFASPGVAARAWNQLLNLSGGQFVGVIPSDHNPVLADLTVAY